MILGEFAEDNLCDCPQMPDVGVVVNTAIGLPNSSVLDLEVEAAAANPERAIYDLSAFKRD